MKRIPILLPALLSGLFLSGCGVVYISPKVTQSPEAGLQVQVVPMTVSSVRTANAQVYVPRSLPAAFNVTAGAGAPRTGAGTVPAPSLDAQTRPNRIDTNLPDPQAQQPYLIGVGDIVALSSAQVGTTDTTAVNAGTAQQRYTVQDDGAIGIANIGRVVVAGQTLETAETELFQRFVQNQIDPEFSLEILEFNSQSVNVGGAVASPSVLPLKFVPLYLDDALTLAGGAQTASPEFTAVRLYRDGRLYQVPLDEARARRVQLRDGDSVFVDAEYDITRAQAYFEEQITLADFRQDREAQALEMLRTEVGLRRADLEEARDNFQAQIDLDAVDRDFVYLTGEFEEQGRFPLPFGKNAVLADAILANGGIPNETGNPGQIYVLRAAADDAHVNAWRLDGSNAANLVLATRFELRPDDIVFVAQQPITRWNRVIQQSVPSLFAAGLR